VQSAIAVRDSVLARERRPNVTSVASVPRADVPRAELDELTLARARRGDRAALAALVDRYGRQVYALVGRIMLARPDLVDDLAQDALVRVIQGLPRFEPEGPARLSTWILTIATRVCLDALRRRRGRELGEAALAALPSRAASPEQSADQRELARRVLAAMAVLPADQRAVLVLRAYHDLDYEEIAQALGVEEGTVKSRLGRARAALREACAKEIRP
jgi:RNA polymerase sigma-70 factor (ECF subfamily)